MTTPVILDLDGSVGALPGAHRVDLRDWHDTLRFACSRHQLRAFGAHLSLLPPAGRGPYFLGSGDFHHLSLPLVARASGSCGLRVLVLDNHPDNMRFPFGVHCGSWVSHLASLRAVHRIDVAGITSDDIARRHAWENRLSPLFRGRLHYWSIGVDTGWAGALGLGHAFHDFHSPEQMLDALLKDFQADRRPVYLSIDKDVLDAGEARTNWDQGCMRLAHVITVINAVRGRLCGSDVNGEISEARYPQAWKRWLAAIDQQPAPHASRLPALQAQQHVVNLALLDAFLG